METIIGLLFILLPVIFKFIEKRLKDSGSTVQAGKVRELAELFEVQDEDVFEDDPVEDEPFGCDEPEADFQPVVEFPQIPQQVAPAPEFSKPEQEGARMERTAPEKVRASVQKPSKKTAPILMEEPKKKKEKIDPKKLVIYSEMMKPKFQD